MTVIKSITDAIENVESVKLLDVDPGIATNRTVVTFVGDPESVIEAAFRGIKKAAELIDMTKHSGEHPRMGATDVCPLVPISGITMEETVEYARKLAERVGRELQISIFCYEFAAFTEKRKNLAYCRQGEYEGLQDRMSNPTWKPDYGPHSFNARAGATAIGARNFLIAYNFNLNTTSSRWANAIAFDVREKGRIKREGNLVTGKVVRDEKGQAIRVPGTLHKTKAIGWYIAEYGIAQISMNLTDITVTSIHKAFDEVCKKAAERGMRVTGSELVGLVPLQAMIDAGKHFLKKQKRSVGISEEEIIKVAIKSLGLDDLKPFNPKEKIIEYVMKEKKPTLVDLSLSQFADETASESPAPGGGSVSAYLGAIGVSLGTMVANLSAHKRGWDNRWLQFSEWAEKGQQLKTELLQLVDEDTAAFNAILEAMRLPKETAEEIDARAKALKKATKYAIKVPLKVMKYSFKSLEIMKAMAEIGNPNSVSDAGVGALAASAAVSGALLNVRINASGNQDPDILSMVQEGIDIEKETKRIEKEILLIVESKL
jgi:glutamate formiminotransferase/formiminotetrahydrofolate cyclodeaminase